MVNTIFKYTEPKPENPGSMLLNECNGKYHLVINSSYSILAIELPRHIVIELGVSCFKVWGED